MRAERPALRHLLSHVPEHDDAALVAGGDLRSIHAERDRGDDRLVTMQERLNVRVVLQRREQTASRVGVVVDSACFLAQQQRQVVLSVQVSDRLRNQLAGERDAGADFRLLTLPNLLPLREIDELDVQRMRVGLFVLSFSQPADSFVQLAPSQSDAPVPEPLVCSHEQTRVRMNPLDIAADGLFQRVERAVKAARCPKVNPVA
jgi:hypothetical protein